MITGKLGDSQLYYYKSTLGALELYYKAQLGDSQKLYAVTRSIGFEMSGPQWLISRNPSPRFHFTIPLKLN